MEETQFTVQEAEVVATTEFTEMPAPRVEEAQPEVQAARCDSCGAITELFAIPHHQAGNDKVWQYCSRCKTAHDLEVATNDRLLEVMAVNPAAVNDPAFVQDIRNQLTTELLNS